jgi:hypothetical protein
MHILVLALLVLATDVFESEIDPYDQLFERAVQAPVVLVGRIVSLQRPLLRPMRKDVVLEIDRLVSGSWNTSWTVLWPEGAPSVSLSDRDRGAVDWLIEQSADPISRRAALHTLASFVSLGPEGGFPAPLATLLTAEQVEVLVGVLCDDGISLQEASWLCSALERVSAVHERIADGVVRQLAARGDTTDWDLLDPLVQVLGRNTHSLTIRELVNRIRWTGPDASGIEPEGSEQERARLLDELVTHAADAH